MNTRLKIQFGKILDQNEKVVAGLPQRESNDLANLMVAAPDMFDALQAVCDAYGEQDSLLMAQVKAALAKAKGEAK